MDVYSEKDISEELFKPLEVEQSWETTTVTGEYVTVEIKQDYIINSCLQRDIIEMI